MSVKTHTVRTPQYVTRYRKRIKEGKSVTIKESRLVAGFYEDLLKIEKRNMFGGVRESYNRENLNQAKTEARSLGLKDALEILYIKEATKGNVNGSVAENVGEDYGLLEYLSAGLLKGPTKPSGQTFTTNPKTGEVTPRKEGSSAESAVKGLENAPSSVTGWLGKLLSEGLIRILEIIGGGILVIFGLWILVKGSLPKAIPVPV